MTTLGLSSLIAQDTQQYEEIIINFHKNPKKLEAVKAQLALLKSSSTLFDSLKSTKNLEYIYEKLVLEIKNN